ncbi:Gremlin-2 [Halotydeus destructor]|nr:Gremlin-2 [Halotydeus destructor]
MKLLCSFCVLYLTISVDQCHSLPSLVTGGQLEVTPGLRGDSDSDQSSSVSPAGQAGPLGVGKKNLSHGHGGHSVGEDRVNGRQSVKRNRRQHGRRRGGAGGRGGGGPARRRHEKHLRRIGRPTAGKYVNFTLPPEPMTRDQVRRLGRIAFLSLVGGSGSKGGGGAPNGTTGSAPEMVLGQSADFKKKNHRCRMKPFQQLVEAEGCITRNITLNLCMGHCKSFFIPKIVPLAVTAPGGPSGGDTEGPSKVFKSCSTCKPKTQTWRRVRLECPALADRFKYFKYRKIEECSCLAQKC